MKEISQVRHVSRDCISKHNDTGTSRDSISRLSDVSKQYDSSKGLPRGSSRDKAVDLRDLLKETIGIRQATSGDRTERKVTASISGEQL